METDNIFLGRKFICLIAAQGYYKKKSKHGFYIIKIVLYKF